MTRGMLCVMVLIIVNGINCDPMLVTVFDVTLAL